MGPEVVGIDVLVEVTVVDVVVLETVVVVGNVVLGGVLGLLVETGVVAGEVEDKLPLAVILAVLGMMSVVGVSSVVVSLTV